MIEKELEQRGFNILGSVPVSNLPSDLKTYFSDSQQDKNLWLLASGGKLLWEKLPSQKGPDPIDSHSIETMKWLSKTFLNQEAEILFPNSNYLLPLQKIGRFLNLSKQSPMGLDISEEFGLWFAFRGVFLTHLTPLAYQGTCHWEYSWASPCENCLTKPCLLNGRLACPYKTEHQYTENQLVYHQKQLAKVKEGR